MESLIRFTAPPSPCGYLHDRNWALEYEHVTSATPADYMRRMAEGWRRFGYTFFRPQCPACTACHSLRVLAERFRPDRSQRRARKVNDNEVELRVGLPRVTRSRLALYDRYHAFQTDLKGWPQHPAKDPESYRDSFVHNPFPVQEWCYYLGQELVGVGYVDVLPKGMSAIYFFYDPDQRHRSLGTWNVLRVIEEAARRGLPHVYLGYHVAGCGSLEYKARFVPNETLGPDGVWRPFRT
ncbi:MAG TPA: arginyltransferase [Gemmataceae bacterium]|nr:arginyltransferase [Gemmataceae bacterium]